MGCGCGGRKGPTRAGAVTPRPAGEVSGRRVQTQSAQRQVIAQQARDRLQQNAGGQQRNAVGAKDDVERRRRIQVSLRNRNKG
jgi:hypothetical protein